MNAAELKEQMAAVFYKSKKLERLEELHAELVAASQAPPCGRYGQQQGSGKHPQDKTAGAAVKLLTVEEQLFKCFDEYLQAYDNARSIILQHETETLAGVVLRRRYLLCEKWPDIAAALDITVSHCHRLHAKALAALCQ